MPNPWLIVGVMVAWLASLAAVGTWQHDAGVTSERAKNLAKENAQLVAANKEIERLRGVERENSARLATIGEEHAKDLRAIEVQRARDVANARAGALKLRVAGACPVPAGAPAPTEGSDGATAAELPGAVTADLLDLTADADRNTRQLTACQAVVLSYLKAAGHEEPQGERSTEKAPP